MKVDYSIYLVTDSSLVPSSSTFLRQIEQSLKNGATIVQLREKNISTLDFVERAIKVHELTLKYGVPLIINDRVDVALAIDAEGVHVGQDDMPAKLVREIIGPGKILGVSCTDREETEAVVNENVADYVGVGNVYQTSTKKDVTSAKGIGPIGVRKVLQVLQDYNSRSDKQIKCVAIGGINDRNASALIYQTSLPMQKLDGVAVVSCIMACTDAGQATIDLRTQVSNAKGHACGLSFKPMNQMLDNKIATLKKINPLVHHITNNVVKQFSANVTLSIGASPIMSELPDEFEEFASSVPHLSLVLNLGTPTDELMATFKHAISVYNKHGKHIVFDPVACGSSSKRLSCSEELLNCGLVSVIKGNVGEVMSIWKLSSFYVASGESEPLMKGVDSTVDSTKYNIKKIAREVSLEFKAVVVITGPINYVSYDQSIAEVYGGHEIMGKITGMGCSLGSTIAAFIAAEADGENKSGTFNIFEAVVGAVTLYNECGAHASEESLKPGTFMTKFIDALYEKTHCLS